MDTNQGTNGYESNVRNAEKKKFWISFVLSMILLVTSVYSSREAIFGISKTKTITARKLPLKIVGMRVSYNSGAGLVIDNIIHNPWELEVDGRSFVARTTIDGESYHWRVIPGIIKPKQKNQSQLPASHRYQTGEKKMISVRSTIEIRNSIFTKAEVVSALEHELSIDQLIDGGQVEILIQ
jgi:hypothetical protein